MYQYSIWEKEEEENNKSASRQEQIRIPQKE